MSASSLSLTHILKALVFLSQMFAHGIQLFQDLFQNNKFLFLVYFGCFIWLILNYFPFFPLFLLILGWDQNLIISTKLKKFLGQIRIKISFSSVLVPCLFPKVVNLISNKRKSAPFKGFDTQISSAISSVWSSGKGIEVCFYMMHLGMRRPLLTVFLYIYLSVWYTSNDNMGLKIWMSGFDKKIVSKEGLLSVWNLWL